MSAQALVPRPHLSLGRLGSASNFNQGLEGCGRTRRPHKAHPKTFDCALVKGCKALL
ncbi:hypothetical protein E2C01_035577 [Portunus trituberculatus]|uniref:Uncharacterized protein n=1 Tax=Portunus trituberculatus TaxID=210409 RepID=A0A5B7F9I9_PORTR|nr:hypothetical protein [Portunus trituberculatus]